MAERPGAVALGTLGDGERRPGVGEPLREHLGADPDAVGAVGAAGPQGRLRIADVGRPLRRLPPGGQSSGGVVLTQQLGRLVEQRHVGHRPRRSPVAQQQGALGRGEVGGALGKQLRRREQVPQQPARASSASR